MRFWMHEIPTSVSDSVIVERSEFEQLLGALHDLGYRTVGPTVRDKATVTFGMYLAMECGDVLVGALSSDMSARARVLPNAIRSLMIKTSYTSYVKECTAWQAKPVDPACHSPVVSSIPTHLMTGEFDPRTPPANGKAVAKTLSHSFLFTYPGLGHGARYHQGCPNSMVWAFFDHPDRKPSSACMASMQAPFK
jgi:pimeloyl-ACP methyl ester carboxylesterase